MKIYIHKGPGMYIGSVIIVTAKSRRKARALIRKQLKALGLNLEAADISIVEVLELKEGVVFAFDGDY